MLPKKTSLNKNLVSLNNENLTNSIVLFKKELEKNFFAEVVIQNDCGLTIDSENLIIDIHCNYNLSEIVSYVGNGTWGNSQNGKKQSPFLKAFKKLAKQNTEYQIDIEELTIFFNDTSIIISKIYDKSIPDQLENILTQIANHYIYYTKGYTEIPYEIYIPVFEESLFLNNNTSISDVTIDVVNNKTDYFKFWALYFTAMDEAVIYDLKKTK